LKYFLPVRHKVSKRSVVTRPDDVLRVVIQCNRMEKTLTIRLDRAQEEALTKRAQTLGKTRSELVREVLAKALSEESVSARAGHLKGSLKLKRPKTAWGRKLRERNWR